MTNSDIVSQRLINQQIAGTSFKAPQQVVEWLGAIQAQEYAMSKWAIGLRLPGSKDADIEAAINEGKILRTHLLRPTWHFVSPKDIRWMIELSASRIHAANGFMCRKLGLDNRTLKKAGIIFSKVLAEGKQMTRNALNEELKKNKLIFDGQCLGHVMMYAELEGIVCSGARQGKQFTYALLDEIVPAKKKLKRSEALAELSKRYFSSRGPATLHDFTTWSNLTIKDAKEGMALLEKKLDKEIFKGKEYFFTSWSSKKNPDLHSAFLMPDYDEYAIGYKDRSAIFNEAEHTSFVSRGNPLFNRTIIIDGVVEGTWRKNLEKRKTVITTFPFTKLNKAKQQALAHAVKQFLDFMEA